MSDAWSWGFGMGNLLFFTLEPGFSHPALFFSTLHLSFSPSEPVFVTIEPSFFTLYPFFFDPRPILFHPPSFAWCVGWLASLL